MTKDTENRAKEEKRTYTAGPVRIPREENVLSKRLGRRLSQKTSPMGRAWANPRLEPEGQERASGEARSRGGV